MSGVAQNMAQAAAFKQFMQATTTPRNIFRVGNPAQENAMFPVQLGSTDPQDERFAIQEVAVGSNPNGVIPGVGQAIAGEDYFNYITRKQDAMRYAEYQEWLMNQADFSTPEATQYWYMRFPWMETKRLEQVDRVADLQKTMAKIQISGPQTEADWMTLFSKEQGFIQVPETAPHLLNTDKGMVSTDYRHGMFSPFASIQGIYPQPDNRKITWSNPLGPGTGLTDRSKISYPVGDAYQKNLFGFMPAMSVNGQVGLPKLKPER